MNLNPFSRSRAATALDEKFANQGGSIAAITRDAQQMGPWSGPLGGWVPQAVNPFLLEALREAIPLLDGGINRLVTLDGIVRVEGGNDRIVAIIEDWIDNVPVNDAEKGLQAFYASQGNEVYEQGHAIGEPVFDAKGRDVIGTRVADSKGIFYLRDEGKLRVFYRPPRPATGTRGDGTDTVEAILRRAYSNPTASNLLGLGYIELDTEHLVYVVNNPEADGPYGTSMLRSLEFVSQILLKIENATGRVWERFGDPPFHVQYKTKHPKATYAVAMERATAIARNLAKAMNAKAKGNSIDLATGAAKDDEIVITVIGAEGEALTLEAPVKHLKEQIVAKFDLPPWMLGLPQTGTGLGEQQGVMVLQAAKTRWSRRKPGLTQLVATMLRARGITWKRGDWMLVQELPNLMDEAKRAQANFLNAQAAIMLDERGNPQPPEPGTGIDNNLRGAMNNRFLMRGASRSALINAGFKVPEWLEHAAKAPGDGEPWAEEDPELPKLEARAINGTLALWHTLRDDAIDLLDLGAKSAKVSEVFTFDPALLARLLAMGEQFTSATTAMEGPLTRAVWESWVRGWANAAAELDVDDAISAAQDAVRSELRERGLSLVRSGVAREYRERIVAELASGAYDGMNPANVAEQLRRQFGHGEYNWERLARSEIGLAQSEGKLAQMAANGFEEYDYITAGDSKVSAICRSLAAAGPYRIGEGPVPVRDSHPVCRCSVRPREAGE